MNNSDGMVKLQAKDFEEIYKMAEAVVATQTYTVNNATGVKTHKALAAQALMYAIDQAREDKVPHLIFTENEVLVLADNG